MVADQFSPAVNMPWFLDASFQKVAGISTTAFSITVASNDRCVVQTHRSSLLSSRSCLIRVTRIFVKLSLKGWTVLEVCLSFVPATALFSLFPGSHDDVDLAV